MTVPECRCQDTARPTSRSSSWESHWGQHGFLPKSWSGSAVLASDGNSSCSKPAGTQEQGVSWNTQGNYTIRTNLLHLSVTTLEDSKREFSVRRRCWFSSCQTYSIRLLLYALLSCRFLSQTHQVFCSLTPGWAVSALAGPLWFCSPWSVSNRWTLSQPSSFRIHGLKVHLQTDLSKSGHPCWLTNTLSLLIKTKITNHYSNQE